MRHSECPTLGRTMQPTEPKQADDGRSGEDRNGESRRARRRSPSRLGRHDPRVTHRQGPHPLLPRHRRRRAQDPRRGRAPAHRHRLGRRHRGHRRARVHHSRRRGARVDPGARALPETSLGLPARAHRARHGARQRARRLHSTQHLHRTPKPRRGGETMSRPLTRVRLLELLTASTRSSGRLTSTPRCTSSAVR